MFITFEGIDGCGKTTQSSLLAKYISDLYGDDKVILTREPGGTSFNELLRNMFLCNTDHKMDVLTELFLFLAMRRESFVKVVENGLKRNKIVISDRCVDSTVAYQGYGHGVDLSLINMLNSIVTSVTPDITFVMDVDTKKALKRAYRNGYESNSVDFYERVRKGFKQIAAENKDRCKLVCCSDSEEEHSGGEIYSIHRRIVALFHEREKSM
ncbi:MAG: dTMP kinase [Aaplasma endosymbiont of Hyalomma asiaticum]